MTCASSERSGAADKGRRLSSQRFTPDNCRSSTVGGTACVSIARPSIAVAGTGAKAIRRLGVRSVSVWKGCAEVDDDALLICRLD